ncbi:hypothetical protein [Streptomyces sp. NPDC006368]|uniref:hypothetical protein n=1 Tax=Streptomyces sp. NPDC006368 TaxID=3156760 RepID=UPI0033AF534B
MGGRRARPARHRDTVGGPAHSRTPDRPHRGARGTWQEYDTRLGEADLPHRPENSRDHAC